MDEFYLVTSYCKVTYLAMNIIFMESVARVRVQSIKRIFPEPVEHAPLQEPAATE
jgi:hypothetical protein